MTHPALPPRSLWVLSCFALAFLLDGCGGNDTATPVDGGMSGNFVWDGSYELSWDCQSLCQSDMPLRYRDLLVVAAQSATFSRSTLETDPMQMDATLSVNNCLEVPAISWDDGSNTAATTLCPTSDASFAGTFAYSHPQRVQDAQWFVSGSR